MARDRRLDLPEFTKEDAASLAVSALRPCTRRTAVSRFRATGSRFLKPCHRTRASVPSSPRWSRPLRYCHVRSLAQPERTLTANRIKRLGALSVRRQPTGFRSRERTRRRKPSLRAGGPDESGGCLRPPGRTGCRACGNRGAGSGIAACRKPGAGRGHIALRTEPVSCRWGTRSGSSTSQGRNGPGECGS